MKIQVSVVKKGQIQQNNRALRAVSGRGPQVARPGAAVTPQVVRPSGLCQILCGLLPPPLNAVCNAAC